MNWHSLLCRLFRRPKVRAMAAADPERLLDITASVMVEMRDRFSKGYPESMTAEEFADGIGKAFGASTPTPSAGDK